MSYTRSRFSTNAILDQISDHQLQGSLPAVSGALQSHILPELSDLVLDHLPSQQVPVYYPLRRNFVSLEKKYIVQAERKANTVVGDRYGADKHGAAVFYAVCDTYEEAIKTIEFIGSLQQYDIPFPPEEKDFAKFIALNIPFFVGFKPLCDAFLPCAKVAFKDNALLNCAMVVTTGESKNSLVKLLIQSYSSPKVQKIFDTFFYQDKSLSSAEAFARAMRNLCNDYAEQTEVVKDIHVFESPNFVIRSMKEEKLELRAKTDSASNEANVHEQKQAGAAAYRPW